MNELLLDAPHQNVIFVLPFLLGAVGEYRAPVAVALVVRPLPLVLHAVGALTDTKAVALVVLPLTHVGLGGGGVDVVLGRQVFVGHVAVAEADGGVGVAGADAAHGGVAARRAALAGDGRARVGLAQLLQAAEERAAAEQALLLAGAQLAVAVEVEHEAATRARRAVRQVVVEHGAVALLAAQRGQGRAQWRADHRGHAVGDALPHAIAVAHAAHPLALERACSDHKTRTLVRGY